MLYCLLKQEMVEERVKEEVGRNLFFTSKFSIDYTSTIEDQFEPTTSAIGGFLESVQQINEEILNKDSDQIYNAARKSGGAVVYVTPRGMMASLPIGFKKLGLSARGKFDMIADSIRANNDFDYAQREMNTLLNSCIACHKTYRIVSGN